MFYTSHDYMMNTFVSFQAPYIHVKNVSETQPRFKTDLNLTALNLFFQPTGISVYM